MSSGGVGGIWRWIGLALMLSGCTSGNIVSDFDQPTFILVDRLGDGTEIRRYEPRAEVGSEVAEIDTATAANLAALQLSGLVAAKTVSGDDLTAERTAMLDAIAKSEKWQAAGDPTRRPEDNVLSLVGVERSALVVPIIRRADLIKS